MNNLVMFCTDHRAFDVQAIARIIRSEDGFRKVRVNESSDTLIDAEYSDDQDSTIVRLSANGTRISLSGTTDAALGAAIVLQRHLDAPLRIVDWDYAFDLLLSEYKSVHELRAAIDNAQAG